MIVHDEENQLAASEVPANYATAGVAKRLTHPASSLSPACQAGVVETVTVKTPLPNTVSELGTCITRGFAHDTSCLGSR